MRDLCVSREGDDDGGPRPATPSSRPTPPAPRPRGAGLLRDPSCSIPDLVADKIKSKTFFWSVELIPGTTPHLQLLLDERFATFLAP